MVPLTDWVLASTPPGGLEGPDGLDALAWSPAVVPGTVAAALGPDVDFDGLDWWFRTKLPPVLAPATLVLDGLATLAEVFLDGRLLLRSESMFTSHRVDLEPHDGGERQLAICFRALMPLLRERRRPRARWRTSLVADGNLRFVRTMLLGRAPGFAPGPPVVGPWRPIRLEPAARVISSRLRARLEGDDGVLSVELMLRQPDGVELFVRTPEGKDVPLRLAGPPAGQPGPTCVRGELRLPEVVRWWPHTHGAPALYELRLEGNVLGRVGFRALEWPSDWEDRGLALSINGVPIFCRGAVWTPASLERPHAEEGALRGALEIMRDAGMNMVRIPGIGCYESDAFHDLCDELGILVWQDIMLANLDYPDADPAFAALIEAEAGAQAERLAGRPSLAVLCGGSEVAQQATMLGLDPALGRAPLLTERLPRALSAAGTDVPYVPNAPWGSSLPFRPDDGVANYYGVGAYRRPLSDARLAGVRFAAECLAFSNVPDEETLTGFAPSGALVPHHPDWKAGIPRDVGAGWDFEDVRDHYLELFYGTRAVELRWSDPGRYLELGRAATGEAMAEAMGEWRRAGSGCAGALVLWWRDLRPGAGWGLLDHLGVPKAALHHLRRALAPLAVWTTDEGLSGIGVHLANDGRETVRARLRVALYRDQEVRVEDVSCAVELAPRAGATHDLETLVGRFVDVGYSYRFGPAGQDLVVVSLERERPDGGVALLSQAFRFPLGRPRDLESAGQLGLEARLVLCETGRWELRLGARRLVHGVRVHVDGYVPDDDAFDLEPGHGRCITLRAAEPDAGAPRVLVTALNLRDRLRAEGA